MTPTLFRLARLADREHTGGFAERRVWVAVGVLFLTPLTSNLPRGVPIPFFHFNELILLVGFGLLVAWSLAAGAEGRNFLLRTSWLEPLFGLLFLSGTLLPLVVYWLTSETVALGNVAHFFDLIQFYMLYRILMIVLDRPKNVLRCVLALVAAGVVIALIGMLEARDLVGVRQFIETYYPSYNLTRNIAIGYPRVMSLLGSPQAYGAFLAINIFVCLTLLLYAPAEIPRRFVGLALVICFFGFIPAGGYSAIIGAVLMFVLLLVFYRRMPLWVWGFGGLGLVVGGIVFAQQIILRLHFQYRERGRLVPATLLVRIVHWTDSLRLLAPSDWLLGYRGTMPPDFISFENQYIALLFRGGILYVVAFVYFIVRGLVESYRTFREYAGVLKPVALCAFIVLVGVSVMSITDSYFTNSGVSEAI
ncbi:MAG TPA: hypothetical protein VFD70_02110, partial [Anaerolineae bacterium]|nr:hypothetical protein [Anaerolineae bacterium]